MRLPPAHEKRWPVNSGCGAFLWKGFWPRRGRGEGFGERGLPCAPCEERGREATLLLAADRFPQPGNADYRRFIGNNYRNGDTVSPFKRALRDTVSPYIGIPFHHGKFQEFTALCEFQHYAFRGSYALRRPRRDGLWGTAGWLEEWTTMPPSASRSLRPG